MFNFLDVLRHQNGMILEQKMFLGKKTFLDKKRYISWNKHKAPLVWSFASVVKSSVGPVVLWSFQPWSLAYTSKEIYYTGIKQVSKERRKETRKKRRSWTISTYSFQLCTWKKGHKKAFKYKLTKKKRGK